MENSHDDSPRRPRTMMRNCGRTAPRFSEAVAFIRAVSPKPGIHQILKSTSARAAALVSLRGRRLRKPSSPARSEAHPTSVRRATSAELVDLALRRGSAEAVETALRGLRQARQTVFAHPKIQQFQVTPHNPVGVDALP